MTYYIAVHKDYTHVINLSYANPFMAMLVAYWFFALPSYSTVEWVE
jgi:hypothetical protein